MPFFSHNDGSEVYIEADRDVFKCGKRIDRAITARLRDVCLGFSTGIGMSSVDIGKLRTLGARQAMNVLRSANYPESHVAIADMALRATVRDQSWIHRLRNS